MHDIYNRDVLNAVVPSYKPPSTTEQLSQRHNDIVANGGVCCPERWGVRSLHLVGLLNV